jgi:acetyl-CoA carboxylase biotin carboxyl carrier protein
MPTNKEDVSLVRELAKILKETDLTEVEVADGDKRFRVKREITVATAAAPQYVAAPVAAPAPAPAGDNTAAPAANTEGTLTSPMVGTVYLANKPGDPPFVKAGDSVKEGQTVVIIEAMKVMNPIKAHKSGTIGSVMVKDAQPVEFGMPLLVIA